MKKKIISITLLILLFLLISSMSSFFCEAFIPSGATLQQKLPIYSVQTDKKVVALTFDAAWGNEDTDALIEILDKYNAKATFFITGQWAEKFPMDVKKFYDKGHDIANHSGKHPHINGISLEALKTDTAFCDEKIKEITGKTPQLYRGPYGEYNNTLLTMLEGEKRFCIQWDVDSLDWQNPSPETLVNNVMKKVENGSIILLHNGAKNTPHALPMILENLKAKGYEFVKVNDLIYKEGYNMDHTGKQVKNI